MALVSVPALAVALAVSVVPSRFKTPVRRMSSALGDSFYDTSVAPADGRSDASMAEPGQPEDATSEPGDLSVAAPLQAADSAATESGEPPASDAPAALPEVAINAESRAESEPLPAAVAARARPLVTVWPSARKRRQAARLAAAAEANAAAASDTSEAQSADAASAAAAAAAVPNIVYVPLMIPIPFIQGMDGTEGEPPPDYQPTPEEGVVQDVPFEPGDE